MIAASIAGPGRVEKSRSLGCVAKPASRDLEESNAGEGVEKPREAIGLDAERGAKAVGGHRAGAEAGEDAKIQPGAKRQGGGHRCDEVIDPTRIRAESTTRHAGAKW